MKHHVLTALQRMKCFLVVTGDPVNRGEPGLPGESSWLLLHLESQLVQLAFEAGQLCLRAHRRIDVDLRYGGLRLV